MQMSLKSILVVSVLCVIGSCKKDKIADSCENNTIQISPSNFNQDSALIFIPSAFTPNGDGLNDLFRPIVNGISMTSFKVCKRNNVIFTADEQNPSWDGTDEDGDACKDGVYRYEIKGNNATDGDFEITGEVSILLSEKYLCSPCRFEDQIDPSSGFVFPTLEVCEGQ